MKQTRLILTALLVFLMAWLFTTRAFGLPKWDFICQNRGYSIAFVAALAAFVVFIYQRYRKSAAPHKEPQWLSASPHTETDKVIGREKDVENIFTQLMSSDGPLVVTGAAGIGKTTVVDLFCERYKKQFDHLIYVSANAFMSDSEARQTDNRDYFLKAFACNDRLITALKLTFNPQDDLMVRFKKIITALAGIEGQNLLVITHASEAAPFYMDYLLPLWHWKILLTAPHAFPNSAEYTLAPLSVEHAETLFRNIYQKPISTLALTQILRGVSYHTLTIEIVAAYGRDKDITSTQLKKILAQHTQQPLEGEEQGTNRNDLEKNRMTALLGTFLMELTENEQEIMRYFSLLPPSGTGLLGDIMSKDALRYYFQKQHIKDTLHDTLTHLTRLNWLKKQGNAYFCSPLVKEIAYVQLKPDAVNAQKLMDTFNRLLVVDTLHNHAVLNRNDIETIAAEILRGGYDATKKPTEDDKTLAVLAHKLSKWHWQKGNLPLALAYGRINFRLNEAIFGENHLQVAASHANLALIYQELGDLQTARTEIDKAIDIEKRLLDPEDLSLAASYAHLAMIYRDLGDLPKAKIEMIKAILIEEAQLDPHDATLGTRHNNLATIYKDLGELPKAVLETEKAIAIWETDSEAQSAHLAIAYANLAMIYHDLGEYANAKITLNKSILIEEKKIVDNPVYSSHNPFL